MRILSAAGPAGSAMNAAATAHVPSLGPGLEKTEVRRVAVRALANLASQPSQHAAVVAAGAVPPLLALLESGIHKDGTHGVDSSGGAEDEGSRRAAAGKDPAITSGRCTLGFCLSVESPFRRFHRAARSPPLAYFVHSNAVFLGLGCRV